MGHGHQCRLPAAATSTSEAPAAFPFPRRTQVRLEVPPPLARAWLPEVAPPLVQPLDKPFSIFLNGIERF